MDIDITFLLELGDDTHFLLPPELQRALSAHTKPVMSGRELAELAEKASLLRDFEAPGLMEVAADNEKLAAQSHISNRQRQEYADSADTLFNKAMEYEDQAEAYLRAVALATAIPPSALKFQISL